VGVDVAAGAVLGWAPECAVAGSPADDERDIAWLTRADRRVPYRPIWQLSIVRW